MSKKQEKPQLSSGIASAPGDIPMVAIDNRNQKKAVQFRHDNSISPYQPTPQQPVTVTATSGAAMPITHAEIWYTIDGSWPNAQSARIPMAIYTTSWEANTSYINHWQGVIPPQADGAIVRYKIAAYTDENDNPTYFAHDGNGFWFNLEEDGVVTFAYRVHEQPKHLPEWMTDAVIYHIFIDRFRGDNGQLNNQSDPMSRHGGTIQGVIDALPYLEDLGINCIWFSPLGPSETYHRYDQWSFTELDPELGTEADLRRLVAEGKKREMRFILDYVPSHGSWKMPEFLAAQADQNAPTANWFIFDEWPNKYRCFLNVVPSLVSFNGNDDGVRQFLIDSALYWLCDIGFDGLRLDHVIGQGMDFWAVFSKAIEEAKPDAAIFGEATDTPNALKAYNGRLQAILDFPLAQAMRMSFGLGSWSINDLNGFMQSYNQFMTDGPARVTFFDNHDMDRFRYIAKQSGDRLKMALMCLLTLPHTPILYYGTEIGLSQTQGKRDGGFGGDHVIRGNMLWDQADWDQAIFELTKQLIALRKQYAPLRNGRYAPTIVDDEKQLFGYQLTDGETTLSILFNLGNQPQTVHVGQAGELLATTHTGNRVEGETAVILQGLSGVILL